ncbi:MAG: hypothetical protein U0872_02820 [Planctomycetaceae bacterium]
MGGNVVGRIVMAQGNQFVVIDGRAVPVENDDADLADSAPRAGKSPRAEGAVLIEEIRVDK